jgi:hydrogenase maturation protease
VNGKLLIAGVGNIFLGDDGFGVEVASRLASAGLPEWVHVVDYGIRGMHLAYDLAGYSSAILIDATPRGGVPGTIYVIEPDLPQPPTASDDEAMAAASNPIFNAHGMQPDVVLGVLGMLESDEAADCHGHRAGDRQLLVIGCEPAFVDYGIGLSAPVAAAVDEAITVITGLVSAAAQAGADHRLVMKEWAHVPRYPGRGN